MTVDPYIGKTIDERYLVKRLIGRGGMGAVYEAEHVGLERSVAIKFLLPGEASPDALARFRREARAASKITHRNVVHIFDVGSDAGVDFIVMEYVDGRDLRAIIADEGALSRARTIELGAQLLDGLAAIHEAGIVHRDIKPGNIVITLIDGAETVKIMDFGIAMTHEPGLTGVGKVIGTPEFMAPEQLAGTEIDHRADLYAVALTLHIMLTADTPSEAKTRPLSGQIAPAVPADLSPILTRGLARTASQRFADAREFANALRAARDGRAADPAEATVTATRRGPWNRWLAVTGILVLTAASGFIAWKALSGGDTTAPRDAAVAMLPTPVPGPAPTTPADAASPSRIMVTVTGAPDGTEVLIGGALLGVAPGPIPLPFATEQVLLVLRADGYMPQNAWVVPDRNQTLDVHLASKTKAVATAKPPAKPGMTNTRAGGCRCVVDDPDLRSVWLCNRRSEPLCTCEDKNSNLMCAMPFERCPGGKCRAGVSDGGAINSVQYGCADHAGYHRIPVKGKKPGERCSGYSRRDVTEDAEETAAAPLVEGSYQCLFCAENDTARTGSPGTVCKGTYTGDGKTYDGHIQCKEKWF